MNKDLCNMCVKLKTQIENAKGRPEEIEKKQEELRLHRQKKNEAFSYMKSMAEDTDPNTIVLCMDLQKVLPCPKLSVGEAFYRRKLSIYNFCIHDLKTEKSHMFLWSETTARRGASEILSCLNKFLELNGLLDSTTPTVRRCIFLPIIAVAKTKTIP